MVCIALEGLHNQLSRTQYVDLRQARLGQYFWQFWIPLKISQTT